MGTGIHIRIAPVGALFSDRPASVVYLIGAYTRDHVTVLPICSLVLMVSVWVPTMLYDLPWEDVKYHPR